MTINVQQPSINKNQKVSKALTGRLLTGFLTFQTLNQRVAGSNPARLTIFFKDLRHFLIFMCATSLLSCVQLMNFSHTML